MARRIFSLPRLDQLTKDQRKVLRLKREGQYLIVGSPGTGKSVVALRRAENQIDHKNSLFLTFNHVLSHATKQLFDGEIHCDIAMSWFYTLQWNLKKGKHETFEEDKMPERAPYKPDYDEVIERFKLLDVDYSHYLVIIDEGQDLPPGWYDCLTELGFENFFIVADQNQQITDENSSRVELQEAIAIQSKDVIELKENWRNVTPIATFSNYFYTDKTSPKPDIPDRPSIDVPILYEYTNIDKIYDQVLSEYDRDPSKLIGFFVPTESKREWYVKKLDDYQMERSNPKPLISTYFGNQKEKVNIDFSYGGIVILNDKSVKGIEFDTVFIIIDDFKMNNNELESLQKRFYVMSSRAREKLFLFKSAVRTSIVDEILPADGELSGESGAELLKRRKI